MAQYTTKRKYTKNPTTQLKKVVKKVKKETVEVAEVAAELPEAVVPAVKSYWQKVVSWIKGIAG